jgi:hypothetical protein
MPRSGTAAQSIDKENVMSNSITRTASTALSLATGTASQLKNSVHDGVSRWVPALVKAVGAGANLLVLRDGGRKVAKVVRRNPVATSVAVAVAAGAGIALWVLRRNRQRRGLDETMRTIEVKSVRVAHKPASKRVPRKAATKTAVKVSAGE